MELNESQISGYEEGLHTLGGYVVRAILYRFGARFVCIVNNLDPGATLCRSTGSTRDEALYSALGEARRLLVQHETVDTVSSPVGEALNAPVSLDRIEEVAEDGVTRYEVTEFLGLPLKARVEKILSGSLVFYSPEDWEIAPEVAMQFLRAPATKRPGSHLV